jgi:hypothetical protein
MANRKQLKNILKSKKALTITSAINFFTQNSNNQPNASERYEKLTLVLLLIAATSIATAQQLYVEGGKLINIRF